VKTIDRQDWQELARIAGFELSEWDNPPSPFYGLAIQLAVVLGHAGLSNVGFSNITRIGPNADGPMAIFGFDHQGESYVFTLERSADYAKRRGLEEPT